MRHKKGAMKERTGYVYKRGNSWIARVGFTDHAGNRRDIRRSFPYKSEANKALKTLTSDFENRRAEYRLEHKTFADLANFYEKTHLIEPTYTGTEKRKTAGLRSTKT